MNYFELFQIPVCFFPDKTTLKKKYYELNRKYHPDFYANEDQAEKDKALEMAAMVNKGYLVLSDLNATIKYVLMEKGLVVEEEKYQLSPDFLMEVMEINEQIMDLDHDSEKQALLNQIEQLQKTIYAPIEAIITNYQEAIATEKELLQVKEYYYQKKYLDRILVEL